MNASFTCKISTIKMVRFIFLLKQVMPQHFWFCYPIRPCSWDSVFFQRATNLNRRAGGAPCTNTLPNPRHRLLNGGELPRRCGPPGRALHPRRVYARPSRRFSSSARMVELCLGEVLYEWKTSERAKLSYFLVGSGCFWKDGVWKESPF